MAPDFKAGASGGGEGKTVNANTPLWLLRLLRPQIPVGFHHRRGRQKILLQVILSFVVSQLPNLKLLSKVL